MSEEAIQHEHDKRHGHEGGAQKQKLHERFRRSWLNELREEGQEENGQLGIENVEQEGLHHEANGCSCGACTVDGEGRRVTPGGNGDVEQVGHTGVLEGLEGKGARMHDGSKTKDGSQQMRNDARRTPKCGKHACLSTLNKARRNGKDNPGAGNEHDDERGDQEFKAEHLWSHQKSFGMAIVTSGVLDNRLPERAARRESRSADSQSG